MSKKLVIRINNLQDLEENDAYEVVEETAIRWDRVIGVAVFVLLLVITAVVGLVTVFNSDTPHSFESSLETVSVEHSNPKPENIASDIEIITPEKQVMPEQGVVVQSPPTQDGQHIVNSVEDENSPLVDEVVVDSVVVDDVAAEKVIVEKEIAEISVPVEPKPAVSPPIEKTASQLTLSDPINIHSEKIVRAQLTNAVSKKEPVDKLGSTIPMNGQGLIKVFLFTDMHGLKDETLYHEWYLAGKRMARVKINVRNNNVSASSSKFIDKYMIGDWKVNVVNQRDDTLVSAQFVVTP